MMGDVFRILVLLKLPHQQDATPSETLSAECSSLVPTNSAAAHRAAVLNREVWATTQGILRAVGSGPMPGAFCFV